MPRPATNTPPRLTASPLSALDGAAREAVLDFVRALAREQAIRDHLAETGQDEVYDPRRDLRPL